MKITEILSEDQLDEGWKDALAKGVGGIAQGIGATVGGAAGAWDRMKQGYAKGKSAVADPDAYFNPQQANTATNVAPTAGQTVSPAAGSAPTTVAATQAAAAPAALAPQQSAPRASAPQATPDELEDLKATLAKLNPDQKQAIAAELQKPETQQPSAPAAGGQQDDDDDFEPDYDLPPDFDSGPDTPSPGTAVDIGQVKKQSAQAAQAAQADKQTAQQQIAATQASNAAKAKQDAAIKAAKDAAMAKPGFQQTAADKLAIKQAADRGIREAKQLKKPAPKQPAPGKKKKILAEFESKFLGQKI